MRVLSNVLLACGLVVLALDPARAQDKGAFWPLEVGTTWTYKAGDKSVVFKVIKPEKVGEKDTMVVEMSMDGKTASSENLAVEKDGVYRYALEGKKAEKPVLVLKLPAKTGESWTIDTKYEDNALKGTFKVSEEKVTVGGKEYNAFVASSDDLDAAGLKFKCKNYYAAGVGLIKQEVDVPGQPKFTLELEKFEPAPKK